MSAPSLLKIACSSIARNMYRSPGGADRSPASPSPASLIRVPSSTPAGMFTDSVFSFWTRPLPWQVLQGPFRPVYEHEGLSFEECSCCGWSVAVREIQHPLDGLIVEKCRAHIHELTSLTSPSVVSYYHGVWFQNYRSCSVVFARHRTREGSHLFYLFGHAEGQANSLSERSNY